MCLSVGITFVARKMMASRQTAKYVCTCACVYMFAYECARWRRSQFLWVCICCCVCVCVREMMEGRLTLPWGSSYPIVEGEHAARHLFFPKWIMKQSQVCWVFSPPAPMTTEAKAEDLRSDRMRLATQRALHNKRSTVRQHEGYESLLTLIDSYHVEWNSNRLWHCMLCFVTDATQLKWLQKAI